MGVLGAAGEDVGRGVLVTAAGPAQRDALHDLVLPAARRYGERWGYQVQAVDLPPDVRRVDPTAFRVRLLRRALREHRRVVWLDPDVLLLRHDEDVASLLRPRSFQGLALRHEPGRPRLTPGVWVLRSCPSALAFLQAVQASGRPGAVLAALARDGSEPAPDRGSALSRSTTWLPGRWQPPAGPADLSGGGPPELPCARYLLAGQGRVPAPERLAPG